GIRAYTGVIRYYEQRMKGGTPWNVPDLVDWQQASGLLADLLERQRDLAKALVLRQQILKTWTEPKDKKVWEEANAGAGADLAHAYLGQAMVLNGASTGGAGLQHLRTAYQNVGKTQPGSADHAWIARLYATALNDMGLDLDPSLLDIQLTALKIL